MTQDLSKIYQSRVKNLLLYAVDMMHKVKEVKVSGHIRCHACTLKVDKVSIEIYKK